MSENKDFDQEFEQNYPITAALAGEPTGFDDIEFVDDDEPQWPEASRIEFDIISTIDNVENLGDALDIMSGALGRYGLDGFTVLAKDADNPERSWVVKRGRLYTTEEFVAEFEARVDEEERGLTEEEAESIRQADLPVTPEAVNDAEAAN